MLIGDDGTPLICDFGRSRILEQSGFTTTLEAGAARYMAPELFAPEGTDIESTQSFVLVTTKESDVYSFAMVGVEVSLFCSDWFIRSTYLFVQILSGEAPFHEIKHVTSIASSIRRGLPKYQYPPEQEGIWKVIESCSAIAPKARPAMVKVVRDLPLSAAT